MSLQELSKFTVVSKYAKYLPEKKRRQTQEENVDAVLNMHLTKYEHLSESDKELIVEAFNLVKDNYSALPSMRSSQFAGDAIFKHNLKMYNCGTCYAHSIESLSSIFYALLCGTGVGISLIYSQEFPEVRERTGGEFTYLADDSIEGWADCLRVLLESYVDGNFHSGRRIKFNLSTIRPKGASISTGGKAPGAEGLANALTKIEKMLDYLIAKGVTKLRSIDIADIIRHSADAVLSGGVRRSALAFQFLPEDIDMLNDKVDLTIDDFLILEKDGDKTEVQVLYKEEYVTVKLKDYEFTNLREYKVAWFHLESQRARSNNSVILLKDEVTREQFHDIIERTRQYGEPGFVLSPLKEVVYNPCYEIAMIPQIDGEKGFQTCNLTTINGNQVKSKEDLMKLVWAATVIGTLQAGYTDFRYLPEISKKITEEEALLGVSILGYMANPDVLINEEVLSEAAKYSVGINEDWAEKLGINPAARVTCTKPDGNSSSAVGSPFAGIHPAHSKLYFRRVQVNKEEIPYKYFKSINPELCEESVHSENKTDDIIIFPIEVEADNAIFKQDLRAIDHLEIVKKVQNSWVKNGAKNNKKPVSHNISCTILVDDEDWAIVADYLFDNKEYFSAVSLLSRSGDKIYQQPPYEAVSTPEDMVKFLYLRSIVKPVDYTLMNEESDNTQHTQEASCAGGMCLI